MSDLISRTAAIEAIKKDMYADKDYMSAIICEGIENVLNNLPTAEPKRLTDDDFETIRIHLNAFKEGLCNQRRWKEAEEYQGIIDRLIAFASAQPERKTGWIPCSERLPEEDREVLITAWRDTVMIAWLDDGEWTNDAVTFTDSSKVNAWMPLPEPYRKPDGILDIPGFEGTMEQLEELHV